MSSAFEISSLLTGGKSPYVYKFFIKDKEVEPSPPRTLAMVFRENYLNNLNYNENITFNDSLPTGFPLPTVTVSNSPSAGKIFLTCFSFIPGYNRYIMIFNNDGSPFFYREMESDCTDLKQISNGNLVYFETIKSKYYELDTNYYIVDSFYTGNGYITDLHELEYLDNGNAYLMSYDSTFIDMSQIVQGGDTNALVIGLIIQEIDANKNVIFQWRSWDHFQITDCSNQDLLNDTIDYVHGNAIESDTDGNILLSSRHLDEITKINRSTGAIMWRLGGKNNQFTFVNDTIGFNHQHDIRRLNNGHITFFDNGNAHTPPFSRAVEYEINEQTKTATLVWQYRNSPDIFGPFMGNVQRLVNGNSIIGWGGTINEPVVTISVSFYQTGLKLFEMKFPNLVFSYRAYRFRWDFVDPGPPKPVSYALYQNYPNPFNPSTNIEFDIPEQQYINIKIYNVLGEEVATLVSGLVQPQKYTVTWDAREFPSGVYFYQLTSANYKETKKMILVR